MTVWVAASSRTKHNGLSPAKYNNLKKNEIQMYNHVAVYNARLFN